MFTGCEHVRITGNQEPVAVDKCLAVVESAEPGRSDQWGGPEGVARHCAKIFDEMRLTQIRIADVLPRLLSRCSEHDQRLTWLPSWDCRRQPYLNCLGGISLSSYGYSDAGAPEMLLVTPMVVLPEVDADAA